MNLTAQRLCAWGGFLSLFSIVVGFVFVAGFIPPPSPKADADEIARQFHDERNTIRAGMIITMFGCTLLVPWAAVFTAQMRRIEGVNSVFAFSQLALGTLLSFEFLILSFFWQVATYRADRVPSEVQLLNDLAWLPFVAMTSTVVLEAVLIAIVIFMDRRDTPIFPRWAGYLNLLCASCLTPGTFAVYFKSGPIAWDGVFGFYVPVFAFAVWMVANSWLLIRAVNRQGAEVAA